MADERNKANLELTATDSKLISVLSRAQSVIRQHGERTLAVFSRVNKAIMNNYQKLGALEKIGIGFGVFEMAKDMIEFDGMLRKIGRTSGSTGAEMAALRQQIVGLISPGSGIPATKGEFADMASEMNNAGVSMQTIKAILPQVAKGAIASRADVKIYSETIGELMEKYKVAASDLPALQDQLNSAMKMEDVRKSPEAFLQSLTGMAKTMQLLKTQGIGNVTPLMALQAQLTQFTGSAGEASGSIEALFNGLLRVSKNKAINSQLLSHGINFFNPGGGVKNITELIPQFKKLAEEAQKSGRGIEEVAMAVFGRPEAAKTLMMITQKYNEIMHKQEELRRSTGSLGMDFKSESESMAGKLKLFQNQLDRFKVDHMSGMLQGLSKVLDTVNAHPLITKGLLSAIGLAGIVVGMNKVVGVFKELGSVITGIGGKGALGLLGRASLVAGVGIAAYELGAVFEKKFIDGAIGNKLYDVTHRGETSQGNAIDRLNAQAGAANKRGDYAAAKQFLNQIKLIVNIDKNGRVYTDSDDTNTMIDVARGNFGVD